MTRPEIRRKQRQRLWDAEQDFFAPVAPGLETICAQELKALGVTKIEQAAGGVGFRATLGAGLRANLWLRSADRVLLRLRDFRVHSWDSLVHQAGKSGWDSWLPAGGPLAVEVSLRRSNLKHRGRIAEVVLEAATASMEAHGLAAPQPAKVSDPRALRLQVRGQGVRCTISLDTTGEHLHQRGYRQAAGAAPLRENLAAGLLLHCGYDGSEPLLDAMCGAGTLAIEAALIARRLAPGRQREFTLKRMPSHHKRSWLQMLSEAEAASLDEAPAPILMLDQMTGALRAAGANAERAGVAENILVARDDFLRADPPELDRPGLLVANPPYGRRLGDPASARALIAALGQRLREAYVGWRCGIVVPRPAWIRLLGLQGVRQIVVPHGGQRVSLVCGEVPGSADLADRLS